MDWRTLSWQAKNQKQKIEQFFCIIVLLLHFFQTIKLIKELNFRINNLFL